MPTKALNSIISGSQNPIVGVKEFYSLNMLALTTNFGLNYDNIYWKLFIKRSSGKWQDVTSGEKKGQSAPFVFYEKSIGKEFKIKAIQKGSPNLLMKPTEDKVLGEIAVIPTSNKTPKITKVVLFNRGAKDPNKAHYSDTLIAQAHCVGMFGKKVEFTLWEDDAAGGGHNSAINKGNSLPKPFFATVKEDGIAEAKIPLSSNENVLRTIANRMMMRGDKTEGGSHEYYVTATSEGKIRGASQVNVNVANPDYSKQPAKQNAPQQPQPKAKPKSQPKEHSAIFPGTSRKPVRKAADKEITHAYFVDIKGRPVNHIKVGESVRIRIKAENMAGEKLQFVVWEHDATGLHDKVAYNGGGITVPESGSLDTAAITITPERFRQGIDMGKLDPDATQQQYFIEVIPLTTKAKSKNFGLDDEMKRMTVDGGRSAAKVQQTKNNIEKTCLCKEEYKDLVWGEKVSCEFRKKVVQICSELWRESRKMEMANGLMAVINVETASSFKAHQIMGKSLEDVNSITKDDFWLIKKDKKTGKEISRSSRAVGLIQFTQAALQVIGEFKSGSGFDKLHEVKLRFAKMGEVNQLDYVKKYFEPAKNNIKTPEDIYLHVFAPSGVGKADSYVLYDKDIDGEKYRQNESVDKENNHDGKITRSEILGRYKTSFSQGASNKPIKFACGKDDESESTAIAKDVIAYHIYNGGKIEKHIPKTIKVGFEKKYKYVYHDKNNTEHELGIFNFKTTTQIVAGNKIGSGEIKLIDIREFKGYNSNGVKLKFKTLNTESGRYYINPDCYAGLLGAMADMNVDYLGFNGFSNYEGKSTGGSKSHRNGEKGDLRYLSKNKLGEATTVFDAHIDVPDQNKFNDLLYNFGWGRSEKMYSEYFNYDGNKNYLLNHTKHMRKDGKDGYRHYHHLHLTGFDHSLIKIINEK